LENSKVNHSRVMPILFLGVLVTALDIAILAPALRAIGEYFAVEDERQLSWVFIAFTLFTQLGIPFMSWLSDVYGRRFSFALCMGLFTVGVIVSITASSFDVLLVGRAIQGLGVSGVVPITSAVIGDVFSVEKRGRMLGIIGAVFGLAFIIGPILSGVLIAYGWQWPFGLLIPISLSVFILSILKLPVNQQPKSEASLDVWGILTLMVAITLATIGFSNIEIGNYLLFFVGAIVFFSIFLFVEKNHSSPFVHLDLFQNRQITIACFISLGAGLSEAVFVFLPIFASSAFDVSDRTASMMLLPLVFALAIGAPLSGRLVDKVGARRIVSAGTFILALGMAVLAIVSSQQLLYFLGIACVGFGLSALLGSAISYILLNESKEKERTVVQGVSRLFKGLGRLIGGAMIGAIAASAAVDIVGYNRAFGVIAGIAIVLCILSFGLRSRKEELKVMASQAATS